MALPGYGRTLNPCFGTLFNPYYKLTGSIGHSLVDLSLLSIFRGFFYEQIEHVCITR